MLEGKFSDDHIVFPFYLVVTYIFYRFLFGLLVHLISNDSMIDPLPNSSPAPSYPLLDLNFNMKLNVKTTVPDNTLAAALSGVGELPC